MGPDIQTAQVELAAMFRIAAYYNWHEATANHFSLAVSDDGKEFLINPRWVHFENINASSLLHVDADDKEIMKRPDAPDPTAWIIHGHLHRVLPQARCVLHVHSPYATAIASLADPEIKPIDQNTARFYNRVAYDLHYDGMADNDDEGARLASALGNKSVMMMGNHGVLVTGPTVAEAFDTLYYLERACQTLVLAYSTGKPLATLSHEVAEKTAQSWEDYTGAADAHFKQTKILMAKRDGTFAT